MRICASFHRQGSAKISQISGEHMVLPSSFTKGKDPRDPSDRWCADQFSARPNCSDLGASAGAIGPETVRPVRDMSRNWNYVQQSGPKILNLSYPEGAVALMPKVGVTKEDFSLVQLFARILHLGKPEVLRLFLSAESIPQISGGGSRKIAFESVSRQSATRWPIRTEKTCLCLQAACLEPSRQVLSETLNTAIQPPCETKTFA